MARYDETRFWCLGVFGQEDMFSPSDGTVSIHHRFSMSMSMCMMTTLIAFYFPRFGADVQIFTSQVNSPKFPEQATRSQIKFVTFSSIASF